MENSLLRFIEELEQDLSLYTPHHLRRRIKALDRLDAYLADWPSTSSADESLGSALHGRAKTICTRLESANAAVYQEIRRNIQRGAGRDSLREWLPDRNAAGNPGKSAGYDYLDELISGVLLCEGPAAPRPLPSEMVPYQPTPARHIFDLIERVGLNERDFLLDLGSGLGQVPLLANIFTGAKCAGIEIEPAYVDCARKRAQALGLNNVTFLEGDARSADLSGPTLFYLYTPFTGTILRDVLDFMRREALRREIRVCTYGPCTRVVSDEPWLRVIGPFDPERIVVFRSVDNVVAR